MVIGNLRTVEPVATRWALDVPAALRHAEHAAALKGHLDPLWPAVFSRPEPASAPDVDEDLYGGFVGNEDRRTLQRLRELKPAQLAAKRVAFQDKRLDELLFRYRARNFPTTLDEAEQERWQQHLVARLHQGEGAGQTLAGYFEQVDGLADKAMAAGDERGQAILEALVDYAQGIAPDLP